MTEGVPEFSGNLPSWLRWVAQDADGTWWGYEAEPNEADSGWYENEVGRCVRLGQGVSNQYWRQALFPVAALLQKHEDQG